MDKKLFFCFALLFLLFPLSLFLVLLSSVSVEAIPEAYQDVTGVTATAADVLTGKTIVNAAGESVPGKALFLSSVEY